MPLNRSAAFRFRYTKQNTLIKFLPLCGHRGHRSHRLAQPQAGSLGTLRRFYFHIIVKSIKVGKTGGKILFGVPSPSRSGVLHFTTLKLHGQPIAVGADAAVGRRSVAYAAPCQYPWICNIGLTEKLISE